MTVLIGLSLLSLLTGLQTEVAGLLLRPFDVLAAATLITVAIPPVRELSTKQALILTPGLLTLMPFFFVHVASATFIDLPNGLREGLQITVIAAFALAVASSLPHVNYLRLWRILLAGLSALMLFNIAYHISLGKLSGWKLLNDPKMTFTLLPVTLIVGMLLSGRRLGAIFMVIWTSLIFITLLSGERKAVLVLAVVTVLLAVQGPTRRYLLTGLGVIVPALIIFYGIADDYTRTQIDTIISPGSSIEYVADNTGKLVPVSQSNAQRTFALEISWQYFRSSPLFGVGTNGFERRLRDDFGALPEYLLLGVHGEFQRVPVENGILGLIAYYSIWFISLIRVIRIIKRAAFNSSNVRNSWILALIIIYFALAVQCGLEASGTRSFVFLMLIALLPDAITCKLCRSQVRRVPALLVRDRRVMVST